MISVISMAGDSSSVVALCKSCAKNVVVNSNKCVKCMRCEALFHLSCAQRIKGVVNVDAGRNLVQCCRVDEDQAMAAIRSDGGDNDGDSSGDGALVTMELEVKYLKTLVDEKDRRIDELMKINSLLEDKIELMNTVENLTGLKKLCAGQMKEPLITSEHDTQKMLVDKNINGNNCDKKVNKEVGKQKGIPKKDNMTQYISQQRRMMNDVLNVNSDISDRENGPRDEISHNSFGGHRGRERNPIIWGSSVSDSATSSKTSPSDTFAAIARRTWIYVGRVQHGAGPEQIHGHLSKRFPNEKFVVEALPVRQDSVSVSFRVGADLRLQDQLLQPALWPKDVAVRKFNFFRRNRTEMQGRLQKGSENDSHPK